MHLNFRYGKLLTSTALAGLLALGLEAEARAAEPTYQFDIPAETLSQALTDFSRTSSQQIIYSEELVRGRSAPGLHGRFTPTQALSVLLSDTDLKSETNSLGVLMVRSKNAQAASNGGVAAQDQTSANDGTQSEISSSQIEEVIVTARKVSESLQTTPVAVTAVTPAQLEAKQIREIKDLVRAAPNLTAIGTGTAGGGAGGYSIRGQYQANLGSSSDAPVATYVDGVYYARTQSNNGAIVDISSAEVLRGPQGTLFGRNTTGGAINITSQAPTNAFEGRVKVGYGNFDYYTAEGIVNVPLSEDLTVRFAGSYDERDGYTFNANMNRHESDLKNYFGRASILWAPSSMPIKLRLTGDYGRRKDHGTPAKINMVDLAGPLGEFGAFIKSLPGGFYTTYSGVTAAGSYANRVLGFPVGSGASGNPEIDANPGTSVMAEGVSADLQADLGNIKLRSITAYRRNDLFDSWDLDASTVNGVSFIGDYKQHQFSQEIQVSGAFGALDVVAGAIFFREAGSERNDAWQFFTFSRDLTDFISTSKGLFAQGVYHVTENLRATGGIRYTWDKRSAGLHGLFGGVQPDFSDALCAVGARAGQLVNGDCNEQRAAKFDYPAWIASIDYQVTPTLFTYIKTSGASMAGGVNFRFVPTPPDQQFGPEHVRDVEFGLKADLLDRRLRTNLAVFHIWRSDIQTGLNPFVPGRGTTQYAANLGKAHQYGLEFEATAKPWTGMEIEGSFAYLHSRYVKDSFSPLGVDRSEEKLTFAPKYTWSLGATQRAPTDLGELSFHADYSYHSTYALYPDITNALNERAGSVPGYGLLNGRIALMLDDPKIELAVWGRNLAGNHYINFAFNSLYVPLGISTAAIGDPRTYGATLSYKW